MDYFLSNVDQKDVEISNFRQVAENVANLLTSHGRDVKAWNKNSLQKMELMSVDQIKKQTFKLQKTFDIYQSGLKENIDPKMESKILWRLLSKEGWSFSSDLFGHISDNEIIEIYLSSGSQYFANSVFMDLCSYDLSDVATYRWDELFTRDEKITEELIKNVLQVMKSPEKKLYYFDIPTHRGIELFSLDRIELDMKLKIFCPLFDQNKEMVAYLTTFEGKKIATNRTH